MKQTRALHLLLLLMTLFGVSCVGTIEEADRDNAKSAVLPPKAIVYDGIDSAIGVAHDKIEVYFPTADGNPDDLTYVITFDGLTVPITVAASTLTQDYRGLLRYTIKNVASSTSYTLKVEVKDEKLGIEGTNDKFEIATTFSNQVCDFDGIGSVSNLAGIAGVTGFRVDWIGATQTGTEFLPNAFDALNYEITVIDSNFITPADFDNDIDFSEPERKVIIAGKDDIFKTVNGLKAATRYYVKMNCIHQDFATYGSDPTYKREENNVYLEIETLDNSVSSLSFDGASVTASNSPGELGLTSLDLEWDAAQGVFDHYRVYYGLGDQTAAFAALAPNEQCTNPAQEPGSAICKKIDFSLDTTRIMDLLSYTDYTLMLVVCLTINCDVSVKSSPQINTTVPRLVTFSGIQLIDDPNDPSDLGKIYLNWALPNLETGVADGILIRYIDPDGNQSWLNDPTGINTTPFNVVEFSDWRTDNRVGITGTSPVSGISYCFQATPYLIQGDGSLYIEDDKIAPPSCIIPQIRAPQGSEDWSSFNDLSGPNDKKVTIQWSRDVDERFPVSFYLVVWRATDTPGDWSWEQALDADNIGVNGPSSAYKYHFVPTNAALFDIGSIPCVDPGKPFRVYAGVVTYVELLGQAYVSYQKDPLFVRIESCADI